MSTPEINAAPLSQSFLPIELGLYHPLFLSIICAVVVKIRILVYYGGIGVTCFFVNSAIPLEVSSNPALCFTNTFLPSFELCLNR